MPARNFTDQLGRNVSVPFPPERIISLVPSQTELLFDLGLENEIAGLTLFCIHPGDKVRSVPRVGGTKKLDLQKIIDLKPDLIIGNKEENERDQVEELMKSFPVWMSDISNLDDALRMIGLVGRITDREDRADAIVRQIERSFKELLPEEPGNCKTAYFIWKEPYMLAGSSTFIDDMLKRGGFENVVKTGRYPGLNIPALQEMQPELIFLSSEPYPFKAKHIPEIKKIWPDADVAIVDGEMFSWYGSRLLQTPSYLRSLRSGLKEE